MSEDEIGDFCNTPTCKSPEENLLQSSRKGNIKAATEILNLFKDGKVIFNINCKGEQKSNFGWTPLHLACYFGHIAIVEVLINHGADVNVVNDNGDTPLHKAAYTSREEIVLTLLSKNANVFIRNGEGETARDISKDEDITKLLKAAEDADVQRKNYTLLHAATEGDIEVIEKLLKDDHPPNINCADSLGNTALHCAAYRGKKEVAVLLLQCGIDSSIQNKRGQYAIDMAVNLPMKQILGVQPVKHIKKTVARFEGLLLRKSRFLGWKEVWTVLEKGVMSFFTSRADSTTGTRRKGYKYLDGADIATDSNDTAAFTVIFSNNTRQRFSVPDIAQQLVDRQKWLNAIMEHMEFSTHYLKQGLTDSDPEEEDDVMPLGTMQDKLQTAQAHQQLLERQIKSLKESVTALRKNSENSANGYYINESQWNDVPFQFDSLLESACNVSSSLSHCLTIFAQQEQVRLLQLKQEQERSRVLQDALHALAQEHHELEKSFVSPFHSPPNSPHYQDTDCDEFFDAFEGDYSPLPLHSNKRYSDSNSDTVVASESAFFASFSSTSSTPEAMKSPVHSTWGRPTLPVPMFSRNDFSVWSILKQCIGKELSKITMPVVFNEPLSFLQRMAENMEFCYLLEKANEAVDPIKRMEYVTAFAAASISSNWERLGKPFNPLLGETFEFVREDEGYRIVYEQVSHHPPVSAFHADSPHFQFTGAIHPKLKLWARTVEIKPEGTLTVHLLKHNEIYTWSSVTTCVHNIIVGKLWMEQCGRMEINCHTSGLAAEINYKPAGWFSKDLNCMEGFILDREKTRVRFLFGKWCSYMKSLDVQYYGDYLRVKDLKPQLNGSESMLPHSSRDDSTISHSKRLQRNRSVSLEQFEESDEQHVCKSVDDLPTFLLFQVDQRPEYSTEYYNFTLFAMALNEMKEGQEAKLPRTDTRFRPDIRRLESGDIDGAAAEKNRLEEKQRETRKLKKKEKSSWEPLWFEMKPHQYAKEDTWTYKGGYWERIFTNCPDIF